MAANWTKEKSQMFKDIQHLYNDEELAEIFGVSIKSVYAKKRRLGMINKYQEVPEGHKVCSTCKETLPLELFNRNRTKKDGFECQCKGCRGRHALKYKQSEELKQAEKEEQEREFKRKQILEDYYNKNKGKVFYCNKCQKEKTIDDYYLMVMQKKYPCKVCKDCETERIRKRKIESAKKRGY